MMNFQMLSKLSEYGKQFAANHSKFVGWAQNILQNHIEENVTIEVTVIKPDGKQSSAKLKITADDLELLNAIKQSI